MEMPTQSRVRQLFAYDLETGSLRWISRRGVKAGNEAGCSSSQDGYRRVCVDGVDYLAHRIIWLFCNGGPVPEFLDHVNGVKDDNRIANLRPATKSENGRNRPKQRNNRSGFKGVCWDSNKRSWLATIKLDGRQHRLGHFRDPEAAHAAYVRAAEPLHGKFARTS